MEVKHAYRYLHFKVISVQFDPDVGDGLLEEPGRPQNQNQLQVPRKRPLCHTALVTLCHSQSVEVQISGAVFFITAQQHTLSFTALVW